MYNVEIFFFFFFLIVTSADIYQVLDFGASRDGVPAHRLGKRILVNHRGEEASDDGDDVDFDASDA